jgi:hypothetical protein
MTDTQVNAERRGMRDMRTAVTSRIRSKPTIQGQRYLDLYVLQRDRFRWKRLMDQGQRSIVSIDKALHKLGFNPESGEQDRSPAAAKPVTRGTRKTINLGTTMKRKRSA